jgi:hypothetical protein
MSAKSEQMCKSERELKSNYNLNNKIEEILLKPYNKSSNFSNIIEKNPFDLNDSKVFLSKGYESTPVKKMNDSISGITHSTNDSFSKFSSNYLSNSEIMKSSIPYLKKE